MDRPRTCDVGDRIRLWGIFTSDAGVDTDPTTVTCKYQTPAGVETSKVYPDTVVKASVGRYYLDLDISAAGVWYYRFTGTGAVVAAGERAIIVRETVF